MLVAHHPLALHFSKSQYGGHFLYFILFKELKQMLTFHCMSIVLISANLLTSIPTRPPTSLW